MTSIAYRDGVLAADTQMTNGNTRVGKVTKIRKIGAILMGGSGYLCKTQAFMDWVAGGLRGDPPDLGTSDDATEGFIVHDGWVICWTPWGTERYRAEFFAAGSGETFCLAAMAMGASAEEAVRVAILLDIGSGGEVTVLRAAD